MTRPPVLDDGRLYAVVENEAGDRLLAAYDIETPPPQNELAPRR